MEKVLLVIHSDDIVNDIDLVAKEYLSDYDNKIELHFIISHLLDEVLFNHNKDVCLAGITYGKSAAIDVLVEYELPDFIINTIIEEMLKVINSYIKIHLLPVPTKCEISYKLSNSNKTFALFHRSKMRLSLPICTVEDII